MECLHAFGDTAGLRSNVQKSNMYLAGVTEVVKQELLQLTVFQAGSLPFRYLGIPLSSIKLKMSDYGPVLDRLNNKINSWSKNTLSHAGRLELIRSVLQGVQCYWMNRLPIPGGVIRKIYSSCRNFFWNSKHPPIAWKTVYMPTECGGLGLRNLHFLKQSFIMQTFVELTHQGLTLDQMGIPLLLKRSLNYTPRTDDSPLLKSLINIKNQLCLNGESITKAQNRLQNWFNEYKTASDQVYRWFFHTQVLWPWKPFIKPGILPKHRISFWMFAHKKFLNRYRRVYISKKHCELCGLHEETFDHLFFNCDIIKDLWERMRSWMGLTKLMRSANSLLSAFRGIYRGSTKIHKTRLATIAATIYNIWDMRNRKIFEDENLDLNNIVRKIKIITTYRNEN